MYQFMVIPPYLGSSVTRHKADDNNDDSFATVCMCALWVNARLSNTLHWLPQRRKCDDHDHSHCYFHHKFHNNSHCNNHHYQQRIRSHAFCFSLYHLLELLLSLLLAPTGALIVIVVYCISSSSRAFLPIYTGRL